VKPQAFLEAALRRAWDAPDVRVEGVYAVGGGCIHNAARISTSRGDVFAKWNDHCPPDVFLREADGLRALRAAESELTIPQVIAASGPEEDRPAYIVMEYLAPGAGKGNEAELGGGLAAIHRCSAETFGFPVTTYCGPTPQDNTAASTWSEFYAERRLRPLMRLLEKDRGLHGSDRKCLEQVVERLPSLLPHSPPPALIHGDLWSGNVLNTASGPGLVDPACAYADREMEFGITTLFGGFSSRFFAAYEEAWPLPSGWRERNPLYQLYHLLNHHLIFGGHYGSEALAVARRFA
jgi:protein-ribulosamine 3-kinase